MKRSHLTRRNFNLLAMSAIGAGLTTTPSAPAADAPPVDLAVVAVPSASFVSGDQGFTALNAPTDPRNSRDHAHGAFGNWPRTGTQWVQYDWPRAIRTNRLDVYWYSDGRGLRAPKVCRLQYWNGDSFVTVAGASGLGVSLNQFNTTTFSEITTNRLRLEFDSNGTFSVGMLRWRVYDSGNSPALPPLIKAGPDRIAVASGRTYLAAAIKMLPNQTPQSSWAKTSGPGDVTFADAGSPVTTASFSQTGEYVLELTVSPAGATDAGLTVRDSLRVRVEPPAPATHMNRLYTRPYKLSSRLWNDRITALIVNWIPHLYTQLSDPMLPEGGIGNFVEAGNKLAGRPYMAHVGYPWVNAYVYNTLESMCIALQVDPQDDADIARAQKAMRVKIDEWIPIILAAQEPDGYIQTRFTLDRRHARHWTLKTEHEGYTAGYFIEAAIAHFIATNGADRRMYDAAKHVADCWDSHIGPAPKQAWYDGHEELEQALIRLSHLVDETEGAGTGAKYVALSRFLLDCRKGGDSYDQTQSPVTQQYEAVGHAVRAVYLYKAMSDMAMTSGDVDYQSAIRSIWDNLVHRKYYLTGGVGSGETSEGFGLDYSLRNECYCESCSGCGELFFQHSMNLAYSDAQYANLYEQTIYNAILGSVDLPGRNFTYTNALDERGHRGPWHACPCCVGNIPRTLLQLPTWTYATDAEGLCVNLYLGSTMTIDNVAGQRVRIIQETDYPWSGDVTITLNPETSATFAVRLRVPQRDVSALYTAAPAADGIDAILLNGVAATPAIERGYAVISRQWQPGDRIQLRLPMAIQQVTADAKIAADGGRVALRFGPLVYNIENVDQDIQLPLASDAKLNSEWRENFLNGVRVITGQFADGSPLLAIPNYARNNRGDDSTESIVWIRQNPA